MNRIMHRTRSSDSLDIPLQESGDGKEFIIDSKVPPKKLSIFLEKWGVGKGFLCLSSRATLTIMLLILLFISFLLCIIFLVLVGYIATDSGFQEMVLEWMNITQNI